VACWQPSVVEHGANVMTFTLPAESPSAAGFELDATHPVTVESALVTTNEKDSTYLFDSPFQEALDSSQWRLVNTLGTFSVFKAKTVEEPDWLRLAHDGRHHARAQRVVGRHVGLSLHAAAPVTLVRSTSYLPGWRATALDVATGKNSSLLVQRNGLIQQVTVPAGTWVVHFHYHAPYIELGLGASLGGGALLIVIVSYLFADERRKRNDKVRS
jgi:hypothetical protein